jgi:hypothetical protein
MAGRGVGWFWQIFKGQQLAAALISGLGLGVMRMCCLGLGGGGGVQKPPCMHCCWLWLAMSPLLPHLEVKNTLKVKV